MTSSKYIPLKKSQVHLIESPAFYYQNKQEDFNLYKKPGFQIKNERYQTEKYPELFIKAKDKDIALNELSHALNYELGESIAKKGLKEVRSVICRIAQEAFSPGQEKVLDGLPNTIELLMEGYSKDPRPLKFLTRLSGNSGLIIEHTVNVVALTLQFCFFHKFDEKKIKDLFFCAFMHDIGAGQIDRKILETKRRLTDKQYEIFQEHTTKGHDLIIVETDLDVSVATVAIEHHERIDGSGYPNGLTKITGDSQLIGIIDCFEPLTYRDKEFRKAKKAYDSLAIIKEEVKQGKFDKSLFKEFISCLIR